jgi:L-seryl-tRNA(Ser) seleniumtransferase
MGNGGRAVNHDPRRSLPSVDRLARDLTVRAPGLAGWAAIEGARQAVDAARLRLVGSPTGEVGSAPPLSIGDIEAEALRIALRLARPHPRRVINATGIVLHTNLGRAPLARGAAEAAAEAAMRASSLELDLETGRRGQRMGALDAKLRLLSGAEAGFACNNGAAAVLLGLASLAEGREVIVSRGELVEIGGSFRVPEIMQKAGVRLVEVGSTNRTHLRDYESAIGPDTALLLKVHRSNFSQSGFVGEVGLGELVALGRERGLPVMEDLGSGTLIDLTSRGFPRETFAAHRVALGADLVCFSGDKLMGGPQAGLALGRRGVIDAMRRNPLARALRLDAMTLAALDWTLACMLEGRAETELPLLVQLLEPIERLEARSRGFAERVATRLDAGKATDAPRLELARARAPVGGGTLPGFEIETCVLDLRGGPSAELLASRLRNATVPVVGRVIEGAFRIDLRSVSDDELPLLEDALVAAVH